jgi:UDP-GlcNAc:undecaprenyl-phosphate/decaprenyl-phosphate GlcNAc-1-phosphate transferase
MVGLSFLQRDIGVFVGVMASTAALTPVAIRVALRLGLVDRPAPHKFHRRPIPYLGGLAVALAGLAALVGAATTVGGARVQLIAIAGGAAAVAAVGLIDDWRILNPRPRLVVQALAAAGLWAGGIRVQPFGIGALDLAVTVLVVLAVTNAVNLIDNMDGVSTGTVAVASLFAFAVAHWEGQRLVSLMAVTLAGACLGFLPYNFSPARIFLGDSGTLFMGFLTAAILIKLSVNGETLPTRATVPLLIAAVPLFDMTLVVISRWRGGRRLFRGGTDHSSHRLVLAGASTRQAALISYGAAAGTGCLALVVNSAHSTALTLWVLAGGVALAIRAMWWFERIAAVPAADRMPAEARGSSTLERARLGAAPLLSSGELREPGLRPGIEIQAFP